MILLDREDVLDKAFTEYAPGFGERTVIDPWDVQNIYGIEAAPVEELLCEIRDFEPVLEFVEVAGINDAVRQTLEQTREQIAEMVEAQFGEDRRPGKAVWERPAGASKCSYRFKCSRCGEVAYYADGNCGRRKKNAGKCGYKYCPNCGAPIIERRCK